MDDPPIVLPLDVSFEEYVIPRAIECGLDPDAVIAEFVGPFGAAQITIKAAAGVTSEQFPCIHKAFGFVHVKFDDHQMEQNFLEYSSVRIAPMMRAIARYEIDKMGFLEGLPRRENYDELSGFLPALEMHCGVMPGAILEPLNDAVRFVEFKIKAPDMPITYRNISCVMHGLTLSGITRFGLIAIEEGPTVSE